MFVVLFFIDFHCRFPASPLIAYNIKFVHRGFAEIVDLEGNTPSEGQGLTVAGIY